MPLKEDTTIIHMSCAFRSGATSAGNEEGGSSAFWKPVWPRAAPSVHNCPPAGPPSPALPVASIDKEGAKGRRSALAAPESGFWHAPLRGGGPKAPRPAITVTPTRTEPLAGGGNFNNGAAQTARAIPLRAAGPVPARAA